MQIRYINRALQRFDSTQVIPTQFVLFTLSVIIGSAVLYRDFQSMTAERAAKFVGGCFMTFLGVYFITSGRVSSDDESTFSTEDEEEAIGLLDGERYQDNVDLPPPVRPEGISKTSQASGVGQGVESPSGSLLSHGIDGVNDNELTPRGILSAAPSSPAGSLTAESAISGPSFEHTSPLRPPSRMSNPWADFQDETVRSTKSEPEPLRPMTPPNQGDNAGQESTVLLQFPPAPGIEDGSPAAQTADLRRSSTPAAGDAPSTGARAHATLETPTKRVLRNSLSHRFSPGPLMPSISGGFSAVVAESLRRGEGSPLKDRSKRKVGRRRPLEGTFGDAPYRDQDENVGPFGETDGSNTSLTLATARLQSATDLGTPAAEAGRSTPALATELYNSHTSKTDDETKRLRSFSDSWNGGLAWLGGALRKTSHNEPIESGDSSAVTQGTVTPRDEGPGSDATNA